MNISINMGVIMCVKIGVNIVVNMSVNMCVSMFIYICKHEIFYSQQKVPTNLLLLTNDCSNKIQGSQEEKEKIDSLFYSLLT